jgi:hypothetical protein
MTFRIRVATFAATLQVLAGGIAQMPSADAATTSCGATCLDVFSGLVRDICRPGLRP